MKIRLFAAAAVLAAFVLFAVGCAKTDAAPGAESIELSVQSRPESETEMKEYYRITQEKAKEMMLADDGHIIVDVRRRDEYAGGHIPGAVCIPNEEIGTEMIAQLPDLEQVILVYCRSGRRSKEAAQKLADIGYTNVYEFGGIIDWTGEIVMNEKIASPKAVLVIRTPERVFYATLENNSSAQEFVRLLSSEAIRLEMSDYGGFEKVADLPWQLPKNDTRITTVPGDVILYLGDKITIYYGENTWNFTKLAHINNTDSGELLEALGTGDVTVEFSLEWEE